MLDVMRCSELAAVLGLVGSLVGCSEVRAVCPKCAAGLLEWSLLPSPAVRGDWGPQRNGYPMACRRAAAIGEERWDLRHTDYNLTVIWELWGFWGPLEHR